MLVRKVFEYRYFLIKIFFSVITQGKMIMQDKLEKERNDAKNAVEEYVYEFRDKLSGPYEKFVCEKVGYSFSTFSVNTDTKYLFCIPWSSFLICLSWK